jgi:hypothetical protein
MHNRCGLYIKASLRVGSGEVLAGQVERERGEFGAFIIPGKAVFGLPGRDM